MKKNLASLSLFALLSACSFFSTLSAVEYNNQVVAKINETSAQIEAAATLYNETIPTVVTESSEISTEEIASTLKKAKEALSKTDSIPELKSSDETQQISVEVMLTKYQSSAKEYFKAMDAMLLYYGNGEYKKDVSRVTAIDEDVHLKYSSFIEANNSLVETLDTFVEKE